MRVTAIGMQLNTKRLDVVGSVRTASEIWQVELDP